jgi:hypothetical protein
VIFARNRVEGGRYKIQLWGHDADGRLTHAEVNTDDRRAAIDTARVFGLIAAGHPGEEAPADLQPGVDYSVVPSPPEDPTDRFTALLTSARSVCDWYREHMDVEDVTQEMALFLDNLQAAVDSWDPDR